MSFLQRAKTAADVLLGRAEIGAKGVVWNGFAPVGDYGQVGAPLDHGTGLIVQSARGLDDWKGEPWETSAVFPCLRYLGDGLAQSPVRLVRTDGEGKVSEPDDPRSGLMARPCAEYDGVAFRKAMALSYALKGDAYAIIGRDGLSQPKEIVYAPHFLMRPKGDGNGRLSHYERWEGHRWRRIETVDVIHVRDGIDPRNQLCGLSPWAAMMAEVLTDHDAARASHWLMRRLGIVPYAVAISSGPDDEPVTTEEAALVKAKLTDATGVEKSGEPVVIGRKAQMLKLGATPEELVLDKVRSIPTERVAACFRLDPMAVHLPSANKKFANYKEAREAAMEEAVLPMQSSFEAALDHALLTNLDRARRYGWRFDNRNVRELQEDRDARHGRIRADVGADLCSLEEGREILGYRSTGTFLSAGRIAVPKSVAAGAIKRTGEAAR